MKFDRVILDAEAIVAYRRKHAFGKIEFYKKMNVSTLTGMKILTGEYVGLAAAKKVAKAMGVDVTSLIKSWVE
ncbi:hypothetical protein KAR91_86035 [Candidatus Pacearchaeota archaeon]|nr:hypothetical protein [Candidatus Pacearchaeota archaeon]